MRVARLFDRLRNRAAVFTHDLAMIPAAWLGAFWLRFNLDAVPEPYLGQAVAVLALVVPVQAAVFWYFGLYRGVWRFASIPDLVRIVKAVVVGVSLTAVAVFLATRMVDIPRSVFPLHALLLVGLLAGPRLAYRWVKDHRLYYGSARRTLIVGAGQAGELLVRDLLRDRAHGYDPVAFVDDDRTKKGHEIHGVRVVDYCKRIPEVVERLGIELILIAIPSASSAQMRRIVRACERAGVPVRTLPRIPDLVSGRVTVSALRAIDIDDLLGREPVRLDWAAIRAGVAGRRLLVTGGGGSIGAELCRQIAALGPARLAIVDNGEFNLYRIDRELRERHPDLEVHPLLVDACDAAAIDRVLAGERPEVLFHAAAYKHVPLLEGQLREAARNNVLGTAVTARAAARHGVATFVLISTDKAVNPGNVLGATKRAAEVACQALAGTGAATRFITVRFGNVLDSAGSVVPLFREQIRRGGPVTVTHPEVSRYFMTIPEACQLILEAGATGSGGEIFVLDMGEPVAIRYLAEQMIRLAGKVPGEDIEIQYIGLRPGEKLAEELFHPAERLTQTPHEKLLLAHSREPDTSAVLEAVAALEAACAACDEAAVRGALAALVPEYRRVAAGPAGEAGGEKVVPIEKAKR